MSERQATQLRQRWRRRFVRGVGSAKVPLADHSIQSLVHQAAENGVTRSLLQFWLFFNLHSRELRPPRALLQAKAQPPVPAPSADQLSIALNSSYIKSLLASRGAPMVGDKNKTSAFSVTVSERDARGYDVLYTVGVSTRSLGDRQRLMQVLGGVAVEEKEGDDAATASASASAVGSGGAPVPESLLEALRAHFVDGSG